MKNAFKIIGKVLLYLVGSLLLIIIVFAIWLRINSPGKAEPFTDSNGNTIQGSISTIEKVRIGGLDQYIIIRGEDSTNPVMLFLHGGPGSPEFAFMKTTNTAIEKDFVMVYWEQRGAGKSFSEDIPIETMTLDQFVSDTKELSEYLAKRFNQEKIYIMGHSWGSFLGILTAYQYPELYHAYFGIGQVCHQYRGEYISFEWTKEQAKLANNQKVLQKLSSLNFPDSLANVDTWMDYIMVERNYVGQFGGGVTHDIRSMLPIVKMVLITPEYTFGNKMNFMNGSIFSTKHLWLSVINKNLFDDIDSMQLPVYIFQGKYDYQTPYIVAKEFFDQLKAPEKEFFTFENSAHSPLMEEVERFNSIVTGLLNN